MQLVQVLQQAQLVLNVHAKLVQRVQQGQHAKLRAPPWRLVQTVQTVQQAMGAIGRLLQRAQQTK